MDDATLELLVQVMLPLLTLVATGLVAVISPPEVIVKLPALKEMVSSISRTTSSTFWRITLLSAVMSSAVRVISPTVRASRVEAPEKLMVLSEAMFVSWMVISFPVMFCSEILPPEDWRVMERLESRSAPEVLMSPLVVVTTIAPVESWFCEMVASFSAVTVREFQFWLEPDSKAESIVTEPFVEVTIRSISVGSTNAAWRIPLVPILISWPWLMLIKFVPPRLNLAAAPALMPPLESVAAREMLSAAITAFPISIALEEF